MEGIEWVKRPGPNVNAGAVVNRGLGTSSAWYDATRDGAEVRLGVRLAGLLVEHASGADSYTLAHDQVKTWFVDEKSFTVVLIDGQHAPFVTADSTFIAEVYGGVAGGGGPLRYPCPPRRRCCYRDRGASSANFDPQREVQPMPGTSQAGSLQPQACE